MKNKFINFKNDFSASIVVFLIALPLCIGIAQASGASAFSGIIAGIIGGIVVTSFSDSKFGVSGPAMGMTAIVFSAIGELGFSTFLLALAISGGIQYLFGYLKLGFFGYFIPLSVIRGMLAAIGIILILKQFPHVMGVDASNMAGFSFKDAETNTNTFQQIIFALKYFTPGAIIISFVSIFVMALWDNTNIQKIKHLKSIPSPVVIILLGIALNEFFKNFAPEYALESFYMLHIPHTLVEVFNGITSGNFETVVNYEKLFTFPNFKAFTNIHVYITALILAVVSSIETLFCVEATDQLNPDKNLTSTNKELKAQGIGNFISGLIGGLPVTQVLVRSSANISANAKTKMSSFYHGILLLVGVFFFPNLLNLIPMASLSAILIVLGYNLVNFEVVFKLFMKGREQFLPFIATILAIMFTDLLIGVAIGLGVAMISILRSNYEAAYTVNEGNGRFIISFAFVVSFLNKGSLLIDLQKIPENSKLVISAKKSNYISYDIIQLVKNFGQVGAKQKNIEVEFLGFEKYGIEKLQEVETTS